MGNLLQADVVDGAAERRVIVFGSTPPEGRDLDLIVRDADLPRLAAKLAEAGFRAKGQTWARFSGCGVGAVDLVPASTWRLPTGEIERLFSDALPLDGRRNLARPAPADEMLLLARRLGGRPTPISPRHSARIAAALAARPVAWDEAHARARAWGARRALTALRQTYETGCAAPAPVRLAVRREELRARGRGRAHALVSAVRSTFLPSHPRGAIVAISGLDGAGKSTQAEALAATLRELDHDATVDWSRITYDSSLRVIARPVKAALARFVAWRGRVPEVPADDPSTRPPRKPEEAAARVLRARFPILNQTWAAVVAGVHAWSLRRALRPQLRSGRIVVRDRYVLDSAVQLQQVYGHRHGVGFATGLVRTIAPPALIGFWLDVPAEVAYGRKPEQFPVERLAARQPLYEAELPSAGAIRIDGTRPPEEICAEIAWETWRRLA